jgi:hypothetical protein
MRKPHEYGCASCGARWIGVDRTCPNGCATLAKSEGEFTKKTLQGDADLKKGLR